MSTAIEVKNLVKHYGNIKAVDGIVLAIVFSAGYLFEWFAFNTFGDFLALWLEITAIYAVAFIVGYTSRKKKSEELNRALGLRNEKKG